MKNRSRRGNIMIFLCLTMSAIVLLLSVLLAAAGERAAEHDLARAMSAQLRATCADFDDQCRRFGLLAYRDEAADLTVFRDTLPPALRDTAAELIKSAPLIQPATLEPQIIRYMKGRLPAVYLDNLMRRLQGLNISEQKTIIQGKDLENDSGRLQSDLTGENCGSLAELLEQALCEVAADQLQSAMQKLFGEAFDQLKDKLLTEIRDNYRDFAVDTLGILSDRTIDPGQNETDILLDPTDLTRLAGQVDRLLNFSTKPFYEKLCLVEYVLGQFKSETSRYAVEQIVTGLNDADQAYTHVKAYLCGIRGIIHLIWILTDQQKMNEMRVWATALSGTILIATSGTTAIDPEPLTYILAIGLAIDGALADCDALCRGDAVPVWPGQTPVKLDIFYQDYLRIFLLIMPRATVVSRISQQLSQILPGNCFTRLTIKTQWHGKTYCLEGGYIDG